MGTNTRLENKYEKKKKRIELPKSALVNKIAKSDRLRMFEKRNYAFKSNLRSAFFFIFFLKNNFKC
jgi:hypothetical protein